MKSLHWFRYMAAILFFYPYQYQEPKFNGFRAQEGMIGAESLDELIETLEEVHGYAESGKLVVLNNQALGEIRRSVSAFTAAIAEIRSVHPVRESGSTGSDEFCLIREQLLKQKELIGG